MAYKHLISQQFNNTTCLYIMDAIVFSLIGIQLEDDELKYLQDFVSKGQKNTREITRARILLLVNQQKEDTGSQKSYVFVGVPLGE